jgi:hypothetical protein
MVSRLVEHSAPRSFAAAVLASLLTGEAANCIQIGLAQRLAERDYAPLSSDELDRPLLLTVESDGRTDLVAIQTHRSKMLVSQGSDGAMSCLARGLAARGWTGRQIIGLAPSAQFLAAEYSRQSARAARLAVRLRTFELTGVQWPPHAPGIMRLCDAPDREILAQFSRDFAAEIQESSTENDLARADRMIRERRAFFWVDGQPVALAGRAASTPNGVRISSVYTPPEFRRRGYASMLVAHLTQRLLDEGRKFVFLNTDQANPTSNNIYQKIGYRLVCDGETWEFADTI